MLRAFNINAILDILVIHIIGYSHQYFLDYPANKGQNLLKVGSDNPKKAA